MSQIIAGGASDRTRRVEAAELNGTFLVRPNWDWSRIDPIVTGPVVGLSFPSGRSDIAVIADPDGWPRMEAVLDGSNLLPFHYLRAGDRMGRSVVKIQREDGATGTGFLVAADVLLTNNHVLPTRAVAAAAVAMANYEVSPSDDPSGRPAVSPLDPSLLFVTNVDLDFTFCGVRGLDFLGAIPLDRKRMQIAIDETVTIVQHPRGRPKEVSLRDSRVVQADAVVVQYSCDTEPGSSGSPVFNNQWRPVAIHHASVVTDSPEGRRITTGSRSRYINEGIRLSAIALWLETAEANTPEQAEQVTRLRALFGGLNPSAGFFGALGRRAHGRSASAFVADAYRGRAEVFDLGAWDTRELAATPGGLRDWLADVGRVVADMGLDLWCLSAVDPTWLGALCGHLWAAHGLSFVAIPTPTLGPVSTGFTSGVLVRQSTTFEAEALAVGSGPLPYRLRVRVRLRRGGDAEFILVPFAREPTEALQVALGACPPGGPDWIFIDDASLMDAVEPFGLVDISDPLVVAAADPRDGTIALLLSAGSPIVQLFLSPNLRPRLDRRGRFSIAADRDLPASLRAIGGPSPIALRLSLDPSETPASVLPALPAPSMPAALPAPVTPALPAPVARPAAPAPPSLDDMIDQKLRELIGPAIARMLAEARATANPD